MLYTYVLKKLFLVEIATRKYNEVLYLPSDFVISPTISPSPPRLKYAFSSQKDVFGEGLGVSTLPQLAIY
jgi:hypothetical protein